MLKMFVMDVLGGMETLWNKSSIILGVIGGFLAAFLGGWDSLTAALATMLVIDYVTGVAKAIYLKKLSSEIGFKGIVKKALVLIIVGVAVTLQTLLPDSVPLREITIMFFICNEGLSILENAAVMIPLPQKLKEVLLQLRDKTSAKDKKSEGSTDKVKMQDVSDNDK